MSRTTITGISGAGIEGRESLRQLHSVRIVEPAEEGTSIEKLPEGVYGFTYSPGIAAPLFRTFRYRAFEMHRLHGGETAIVAYAAASDAERVREGKAELTITVFHDRQPGAEVLVVLPYSRIARHRQYSVPNTAGLEVHLLPA